MKQILSIFIFSLCFNIASAQSEWKDRSDFFEVFQDIFSSAELGDFNPAIERKEELAKKFSPFFKSAMIKFSDPKDVKKRRDLIVLSERMTYFGFLNKNTDKYGEVWYGRLVLIHNKYRKILLDDEEPQISNKLMNFYEKEEKDFLKKEKQASYNQTVVLKKDNNSTQEYTKKGFVRINGVGDSGLAIEIEANVLYISKKEDTGVLGIKEWRKYIQKYEGIRFRYPTTSNKWFSFTGGETFGRCNISGTDSSANCLVLGGLAFKLNEPTFY